MIKFTQIEIPAKYPGVIRSIAWQGDAIVDWLGGYRYRLDGSDPECFGSGHTYRFDSVTGMDDLAILTEALGTKGLIVRDNGERMTGNYLPMGFDILREIDRSYYYADAYTFPSALFRLPDGRPAVAHCPRGYNVLDIELLDGECLTPRPADGCDDVFHSRLQVSPDGRWLLSNGWVWHPYCVAALYDIERALRDPSHLSTAGVETDISETWGQEVAGAVFAGDNLVLAAADVPELAILNMQTLKISRTLHLEASPGTRFMALGSEQLIALDNQPRIINLLTGHIVHQFDSLNGGAGLHQPSVKMASWEPPWLACDTRGQRFALADADRIVVVTTEDIE